MLSDGQMRELLLSLKLEPSTLREALQRSVGMLDAAGLTDLGTALARLSREVGRVEDPDPEDWMQKMIEQAPEVYKKWKKSGRIEEWITPFGTLQILKPAFPSWCELDWPKLRYRRPEDNKRGQPIKI